MYKYFMHNFNLLRCDFFYGNVFNSVITFKTNAGETVKKYVTYVPMYQTATSMW